MTTDENGAYQFEKLASGNYVVAFSVTNSNVTGATSYQIHGENDDESNDGMKLGTVEGETIHFEGIDCETYNYAIAYSLDEDIPLHTLNHYRSGAVTLDNYQENCVHQDLGLICEGYGAILPMTGGTGYNMAGIAIALFATALVLITYKRKKQLF